MKLSFVIPAFNEENYIRSCIESIILQCNNSTYKNEIEIIVVNNASTDNTEYIANSFGNIVKVVNEPRKGLTYARQAGYNASIGELIANIDADCRLPNNWINNVLNEFDTNSNLAALSGPFIYYDLSKIKQILVNSFYYLAFLLYFFNRHILRIGSMVQGGNFIVRRSMFEKINGFNLDINFYGEDTDIARRLHEIGDVLFTNKLKMFSSARRLKYEGVLIMAWKYSINYFWTIFFKRPYTDKYIDIRENL